MENSPANNLYIKDRKKIGKVFLRGMVYTAVTFLIVIISHLNVPAQYAFLLPMVTTLLTTISYTVKRYMQDNTVSVDLPTPTQP